MRRSLVVSLALLAIVRSPAVAQTCQGLASFKNAPVQVSGNASFADGTNAFGAGLAYGLQSGLWGGVGVGTRKIDALDGSSLNFGGTVGYQMAVGNARASVCPVASFGIGSGPKDIGGTGNDMSTQQARVGLSVGTSMGANPRMKILPHVGLALAYDKAKLTPATGPATEGSETYGLATLGVGLLFNSNLSLRPSVEIPVGSDLTNDPTFGLTVGMNFGQKHSARR